MNGPAEPDRSFAEIAADTTKAVTEGARATVTARPDEESLRKLYAETNQASGLDLTSVSVTVGPETYSPIKYNTFTIGPVRVSADIKPGETIEGAYIRAAIQASTLLECEFKLALARHFGRLKEAVRAAAADSMGRDVVNAVKG